MTLTVRERPYEVVIRIAADGAVQAHYGAIQEVVDEAGAVQSGMAKELPVRPLDLAGPEYGRIVSEINGAVLAHNRQLQQEALASQSAIAALQDQLTALQAQLAPSPTA